MSGFGAFDGFECPLMDPLMYIVADYLTIQEPFCDLFPKVKEYRVKNFYDHKTQTIDGVLHSIDDKPIVVDGFSARPHIILTWYRYGVKHRDSADGFSRPAMIRIYRPKREYNQRRVPDPSESLVLVYYRDGRFHRKDGPAIVSDIVHGFYLYGTKVERPKRYGKVSKIKLSILPDWYEKSYKYRTEYEKYIEYLSNIKGREVDYEEWVNGQMNKLRWTSSLLGSAIAGTEDEAITLYEDDRKELNNMPDPHCTNKYSHTTISAWDARIINDCTNAYWPKPW